MNSCKDIDQTNSFKCDFCSSFFRNVCNFDVNQDDIQAGCCLNCNCELFPFSSCYSLDENDSRINYFYTSFNLSVSLMNQICFPNTFSENTFHRQLAITMIAMISTKSSLSQTLTSYLFSISI